MHAEAQVPADGSDVMRQFIPASPFAAALGLTLESIEPDRATIRLPYDQARTTMGDMVHGGAIATVADVAAMACSWAGADVPANLRGITVSMALDYLDAARAEDLFATGTVVRRGRSLCRCVVDVAGADGRLVAKALATYKLG